LETAEEDSIPLLEAAQSGLALQTCQKQMRRKIWSRFIEDRARVKRLKRGERGKRMETSGKWPMAWTYRWVYEIRWRNFMGGRGGLICQGCAAEHESCLGVFVRFGPLVLEQEFSITHEMINMTYWDL
jgi:hypothetical protein